MDSEVTEGVRQIKRAKVKPWRGSLGLWAPAGDRRRRAFHCLPGYDEVLNCSYGARTRHGVNESQTRHQASPVEQVRRGFQARIWIPNRVSKTFSISKLTMC